MASKLPASLQRAFVADLMVMLPSADPAEAKFAGTPDRPKVTVRMKPEGGKAFMSVVDEHLVSFWLLSDSSRGHGCCRDGSDRRPVRDRA